MRYQLSVFSSLSFGRQREAKLLCGFGNPLKKWGRYWGTTGRPWWKSLHFSGFWAQCADKTCIAISREGINNTTFFVLGYSKRETCWKKNKNYTHQQNIKKQNKTLWNFNQPWLLITLAAHINPCDFEDSIAFHDAKKKSSESLAPKLLMVFEDVGMGKFTSIQMCTTEQCFINAKCSHLPLFGGFPVDLRTRPKNMYRC